jgi:hypothetical protein
MDGTEGVLVDLDSARRRANTQVPAGTHVVTSKIFRGQCGRCDWVGSRRATEADALADSKAHAHACPVFRAAIRKSDRSLFCGKSVLLVVGGLLLLAYGSLGYGLLAVACGAVGYWWFDRRYRPLQPTESGRRA